MFNVVLVHPEIPPNTGNVIRLCANTGCTLHLVKPLGSHPFADSSFTPGDWFVFGCEGSGLPEGIRNSFPEAQRIRLPMRPKNRSLNLSNAVAVTVFEAWRQNGYDGGI